MKVLFAIIFLFLCSLQYCFTQSDKIRLAQSYEQQGDFANSFRLYSQLLDSDPTNVGYFLGIVRSLNNQHKYTELLPIAEKQAKNSPSSVTYSITAETYWRLGQPTKADEYWKTAIQEFSFSDQDYATIANSQLSQRQIEKAVTTFTTGRKKLNDVSVFAEELSQCYAAIGNTEFAMNEILILLKATLNISVVQGKITALLSNSNNNTIIEKSLLQLKDSDTENLLTYRLIEWFYRSTNQPQKALSIVSELDAKSGSNGGEIFQFASVCSKDGLFDEALDAYSLVIDNKSATPNLRISAIFGYTRTLETKLSVSSQITKGQIADVLQRYESIVKDPSASSFAPEIIYRKGMVLKTFAKDVGLAKKEFTISATTYNGTTFAALSRLELAEIAIVENSFDEAKKILQPLRALPETNELRRRADFFVAEMLWYEGNVDSAKTLYSFLSKKVMTNEANDALARIILIEQNQEQKPRLQQFARAEFLGFQLKYTDAISAYQQIISENPTDDISELAYLELLELNTKSMQLEKVLSSFTEFTEKFPESIWGDKALYQYASALKQLQRLDESKKAFQQLLAKFPSSTFLSATREELKKIAL